eukprot:scaffold62187_cov37-Attheya_sp.AAC.2
MFNLNKSTLSEPDQTDKDRTQRTNEGHDETGTFSASALLQDRYDDNNSGTGEKPDRDGVVACRDSCSDVGWDDVRRVAFEGRDKKTHTSTRGFLVHDDINYTTEGFGSNARGNLFPLIHIALATRLVPIYSNKGLARNRGRDYKDLDVAKVFGFEDRFSVEQLSDIFHTGTENQKRIIEVNTWTDRSLGSACGDATILVEMINEHISLLDNGKDENGDEDQQPWLIILYGALRYINPSPAVHSFLQKRSIQWKKQLQLLDKQHKDCFRIAMHIRVPEEWCPQVWKDVNHVDKFESALRVIHDSIAKDQNTFSSIKVDVFTEDRFSIEAESKLRCILPKDTTFTIQRGSPTTILSDLQTMACADVLVVSSSHFSALAGYLCTPSCLIVLADDQNDYFDTHTRVLGCTVLPVGCPELPRAIQLKFTPHSSV